MEEIAQVYARSLFEAAESSNKVDEIKTELVEFTAAIDSSDDLASLRAALEALDPDSLTPRAALQKLYELKKLLAE